MPAIVPVVQNITSNPPKYVGHPLPPRPDFHGLPPRPHHSPEDGQHVYIRNGQVYYSVYGDPLPNIPLHASTFNVFSGYHSQWITVDAFWLAFTPRNPNLSVPLFSCLDFSKKDPPITLGREDDGDDCFWRLDPKVFEAWKNLEIILEVLIPEMTRLARIPVFVLKPWLPSRFRYGERFYSQPPLVNELWRARMAFIACFTYVSAAICMCSNWDDRLEGLGHAQLEVRVIRRLRASWVADMVTERTGAFVDPYQNAWILEKLDSILEWKGVKLWIAYGDRPYCERWLHPVFEKYFPRDSQVASAKNYNEYPILILPPPEPQPRPRPQSPTPSHSPTRFPPAEPPAPFTLEAALPYAMPNSTLGDPNAPTPGYRQVRGQHPSEYIAYLKDWLDMRTNTVARREERERKEREAANQTAFLKKQNVYLWEILDPEGVYWTRSIVGTTRGKRRTLWEESSPKMRIYNYVFDEWDVWMDLDSQFVPDDDDGASMDEEYYGKADWRLDNCSTPTPTGQSRHDSRPSSPPFPLVQSAQPNSQRQVERGRSRSPVSAHRSSQSRSRSRFPSRLPSPAHPPPTASALALAIMALLPAAQTEDSTVDVEPFPDIARQRYGFLADGTPPSDLVIEATKVKSGRLAGVFGFTSTEEGMPALLEGSFRAWAVSLLRNASPPPALSDLVVEDPRSLVRNLPSPIVVIKVSIQQSDSQNRPGYLFKSRNIDASEDYPWDLVVESAVTACEVLRRGWGPSKTSLLRQLVQRGVPFRLLIKSLALPSLSLLARVEAMRRLESGLSWRAHGFKATAEDYAAYEDLRDAWLEKHSNAHAALAHGGIVWRLAVHSLSAESLFNGPRAEPERQRGVLVSDIQYVEDTLTVHELELICGVYHVLNGKQACCEHSVSLTNCITTDGSKELASDTSW